MNSPIDGTFGLLFDQLLTGLKQFPVVTVLLELLHFQVYQLLEFMVQPSRSCRILERFLFRVRALFDNSVQVLKRQFTFAISKQST